MSFFDNGSNEVVSEYTVSDEFQGYPGIVHGGVVAAMLDEAVCRVAMIKDHNHFMMSAKMELKYRQPVPTEVELRVVGRIVRLRGRLGKAKGEIILPNGNVAVESTLTMVDVPAELMAGVNFEALGWHIDG